MKQFVRHLVVLLVVAILVITIAATSCHMQSPMATVVLVGSNN